MLITRDFPTHPQGGQACPEDKMSKALPQAHAFRALHCGQPGHLFAALAGHVVLPTMLGPAVSLAGPEGESILS